jgi:hypothetical protein
MQYVVTIPLKSSLLISLSILRELPQQKIPRASCGGGDPSPLAIFLHSHVPMERFFDGIDQEKSKPEGGKGQIRKTQRNKKERMEERKEKKKRFLCTWRFPYPCVLHQLGICPGATALV